MDTKKLRQKILDLAIHGKLVPQDPNDEPASVLLERIRAEKETLIKEGKIKRTKKTTSSDTSHYENVPFEVPEGWCWCRLDELCDIKGGKRVPRGMAFSDGPTSHIYIRVTNMKKNTIIDNELKYIDDEVFSYICKYTISKTDLYLTIAGTIGDVGEVPDRFDEMSLTENAAKLTNIICDRKYLMYSLLSTHAQAHFSSKFHQVAQPKLSIETANSTLVPIPPLSEQSRIVTSIERWLSIADILDDNTEQVSKTVESAKAKILDLAIHGKLVSQDPTDEPASELLKRINPKAVISCDKPHYTDLPKGWVMLKGKDLFKPMKSTKPSGETFKYIDIDSINNINGVVTAPKILKSSDAPSRATRFTVKGDIVFSMVRPYLRNIAIVPENGCIASTGFYVCSPNGVMSSNYCHYLMTSNYVVEGLNKYMKGDNSPSINNNHINEWLFPVPPLKEQVKIVSKLQDILSQLDSIMSSLQA